MRLLMFEAKPGLKSQGVRVLDVSDSDTYNGLRDAIGGNLEALSSPVRRDILCYINEDGKALGLPVNPRAENFLRSVGVRLYPWDRLVGNMVVVGTLDEDGKSDCEEHDVPEQLAAAVVEQFEMECRVWGDA